MTDSEAVKTFKGMCVKLTENQLIAYGEEIPQGLRLLGTIIEHQHNEIQDLKTKVAELQRKSGCR